MRLICGDCLDVLPTLPAESVDLIFCDPPYNIGIFSKMPPDEYLSWCEAWIAECSRVLAANGAFWVSHKAPDVLVELSGMIAAKGRKRINWVTWDKYNEQGDHFLKGFLLGHTLTPNRCFNQMAEYLIYHADVGALGRQIKEGRDAAGLKGTDIDIALGYVRTKDPSRGTELCRRWEEGASTPKEQDFIRAMRRCGVDAHDDYGGLCCTFNNPGKVSSVWQIPPAPSNGHPTPKPEALLERIILATSNEGDMVLDPFMGSGTTGAVAAHLGRDFTGIDINERWVAFSEKRIAEAQAQQDWWGELCRMVYTGGQVQ